MSGSRAVSIRNLALLLMAGASLAACATTPRPITKPSASVGAQPQHKVGKPYQVRGVWYTPRHEPDYDRTGVASWYGNAFHMKPTANGERFDMYAVTAAHPTLPLPSIVEVTNLENGRSLQVRVNDRGPFVEDRLIDLSAEGARQLGFDRKGLAKVRVRYVGPAPLLGPYSGMRYAAAPVTQTPRAAAAPPPSPRASEPILAGLDTPAPVTVAPGAPVIVSTTLPPLTHTPAPPISAPFRIQAAAFSDPGNAQRAADRLSATGVATIEPVKRNGATLYRVLLQGGGDDAEAERLRQAVAASGFSDARVLRGF